MWNVPLYQTNKLTLELRELVDNNVDIWDFEYPSFYTGEEKKAFEQKVIDHYYFRQIGQETVGRFKHYFKTRIREIMPYYIRMYESVKLMDNLENPFDNVDIVETFEEETTGTGSATSSASSESTGTDTGKNTLTGSSSSTGTDNKTSTEDKIHKFSNTPQGAVSNLDSYMSEASVDDNSYTEKITSSASGEYSSESNTTASSTTSGQTSATNSSESSGTVKHTLTRKGNQGVNTYAHDIMEYRKSLIDIDMMIINNLQDLFLGVY